jgi:hypothetical protein
MSQKTGRAIHNHRRGNLGPYKRRKYRYTERVSNLRPPHEYRQNVQLNYTRQHHTSAPSLILAEFGYVG